MERSFAMPQLNLAGPSGISGSDDAGRGPRNPYPRDSTLVSLFAAQVQRCPEAPAVVYGEESLTYAELDRRSNRLARHLLELGVGAGSLVGVCLERSASLIVSFLAILKAGGAYLPLDPAYPADRLRWMLWMLEDTGVRLVIDGGALEGGIASDSLIRIRLDRDAEAIAARDGESLPPCGCAEDLAYVMYTSGSTGLPKGVAVTQRGIARLVIATNFIEVGPGDRVLQAATPSFDASTFEIWGALLNGGCLVGLPREVCLSPRELAAALRREGITSMVLTSALVHQVARELPEAFHGVRDVLFGGEAADPHLIREILAHSPPERLVNFYGPTENTVAAAWHLVREVPEGAVSVPIGLPIANTHLYVVDAEFRPLSPGEAGKAGELVLGGDGLARGYWARPEVTAEMFVPDPFAGPEAAGARLYRTGDLTAWREDGTLDFLGRLDRQVKIRGVRIEPGEVEAALSAHPKVRQAHVAVRPNVAGENRLVGYVVADGGVDSGELRSFLAGRVPAHLIPSAIVLLDTLPLNFNGKLDRDLLPDPDRESSGLREYVEPRTAMEIRLAAVWTELLGVEKPGVEDDFFALGGHSIVAGRLISRLGTEIGVELPLVTIYEHPTLARLAWRVEQGGASGPASSIRAGRRPGPAPLSYPQRRLWFLDQLEPGSAVYNVPLIYRMSGPLAVPVLERGLTEIVRRHEVLRTVFEVHEGEPVQVVQPEAGVSIRVVDLASAPDREAEAGRLLDAESRRPFDLERGPLVRPVLLRLGPAEHLFCLGLHHIACDGASAGVLSRELEALYGAFLAGEPSPLPELPLQYADFADWQRRTLTGPTLEALLVHWRARLDGVGDLPSLASGAADRPRPAVQTYLGDHLGFELPPEILEPLESLARQQATTLFTVLLTAFFAFLQRHTGGDGMVVGSPAASRGPAELEPLIGLFLNTLVLRADLAGDPLFVEALDRVRSEVVAAVAHQDLPFERLVEELQPERDLGRNPLFDVLFSFREGEGERLRLPGLSLEPLDLGTGTAKVDLTLSISRAGGRLRLRLEYSTDLFDRATAERLAGRIRALFAGVAESPQSRLSELPALTREERLQMFEAWNGAAAPVPDTTIHGEIAAQALRTPDAVALVWRGEPWTFSELEDRASRLAGRLRSLGVTGEAAVGIHLERSAGMVAAVLAVLKAGGSYVPLDPAYPTERRAFMLADSAASVVITTRALAGGLPEGLSLLCLDEAAADRWSPSSAEGARGEDCAYILYTSGSTGRPKGVQVTHRNAVSFFAGMDRVLGTEPGTWLAVTSLSFDISVLELLWTLSRGFRVVVGEADRPLAPQISASGATHLQCTPSLAGELAMDPQAWTALASLRYLMLGGETLPPALAETFAGLLKGGSLLNLYGPTETTVWSATHEVTRAVGSVPIGRPIANARIHICGAAGQVSPLGVAGELAIGGPGVSRGYLGRPDLTAERFVPDPFGEPGSRLYRTGDLARWNPAGELEHLGRLDHQIKIRGHRVELGEIEAALAEHPSVVQAAVLAFPGESRLAAFVAGPQAAAGTLLSHLESRLPGFMVPAEVILLPSLPLTPNGKLDRRALAGFAAVRPASEGRAASSETFEPPRTPFEEEMALLWCEVLGVGRAGVQDTFWSLGGHSLLATRLLNRLQSDLGVDLPLRSLFQAPTLGGFSELVARTALDALEANEGPAP